LSGGTTEVWVETIDTGERRDFFGFSARHLVTTRTFKPGPGAVTNLREVTQNGWYVALDASYGCAPPDGPSRESLLLPSSGKLDRFEFHRTGVERPLGLAVELNTKTRQEIQNEAAVSEMTAEVVELSAEPLDPALFDLPDGYTRVEQLARTTAKRGASD
jgi:hypothetical protein